MGHELGPDASGRARFSSEKHEHAVARTLEFAEEAAGRGDFTDALSWLATVQAVDRHLPPEYLTKQEKWRLALTSDRSTCG